ISDQLNLGPDMPWAKLITTITILYGLRERYTPRQVANAIATGDDQTRDDFIEMPADKRELLDRCYEALAYDARMHVPSAEHDIAGHQNAVITLMNALKTNPEISAANFRRTAHSAWHQEQELA
ncbi:MAG: hypothetical protein ACRC8Q_01310, partial [Aeromonas sp.]